MADLTGVQPAAQPTLDATVDTTVGATLDDAGLDTAALDSAALDRLRESMRGTLIERMGIEVVSAAADRVVARMPVAGNTQPFGLLHGGASAVLAESVGSVAAMLQAGEGRVAVGLDINATHHRSATQGYVTGTATALSLGRTIAAYEVVVEDEAGRRVCTARLTCLLRDAPGR